MSTVISRAVYNVVGFVLSLLLGPAFLFRERGRRSLLDRYGSWSLPSGKYTWFHGASLGEVNGLVPIIRAWREIHNDKKSILSATSVTGLDWGGNITSFCRILPFDSPIWINRALREVDIETFVFAETEIWPSLIKKLHQRGTRIYMVNARIEERSMSLYEGALGGIFREALKCVVSFCVTSDITRDRLVRLGVSESKISVTGNAKYDVPKINLSNLETAELKKRLFQTEKPTVVLASIRTGEEEVLFDAIKRIEGVNIIIAPRHAEKFTYFKGALNRFGIDHHTWSGEMSPETNVCLLDTFGVLSKCLRMCDGAFIGGTLKPYGGHNPLEAAGIPIAIGPHTQHIQDIVNELDREGSIIRVENSTDVAAFLSRVRDGELSSLGAGSERVASKMRGASERILKIIDA